MFEKFLTQSTDFVTSLGKSLWKYTITKLAIFVGIIGFLQTLGIWELLLKWLTGFFWEVMIFLSSLYFGIPIIYWVIALLWFAGLTILFAYQHINLQVVSGVFTDNFKKGLYQWEFGGEGWKIEEENGDKVLSVSESGDGGITKKGFSWSDYEFTFETKVINECSSWIIRAENRNKYFMIQLNLTDPDNPRLRPHLRINDPEYPWIALETNTVNLKDLQLKAPITKMSWIKVKILVRASEIDVYLNGEHTLHFFLADPIRFEKQKKIHTSENKEVTLSRDIVVVSFPVGRVGFRCSGSGEHAHFKNVIVKPILW